MSSERFSRLLRSWVYRVRPTNATSKRTSLLPRLRVQEFEERVVPAVLPLPTQTQPAASVSLLGIDVGGDIIGPVVVASPINPLNQVLVATVIQSTGQSGVVGFASNNGGLSWNEFLDNTSRIFRRNDNSIDPTGLTSDLQRFTNAYNPSVAFDRDGSVYVSQLQTNLAKTSGELVFNSFNFSGGSPTTLNPTASIYKWIGQDPAFNPTVVVDNNAPTVTDPVTGGTRSDPSSGKGVYVTWNSNTTLEPANQNPFQNQNAILIAGSADRGANFSNPVLVTDGGYTKNFALNTLTSGLSPVAAFAPATSANPGKLTVASTGSAEITVLGNKINTGIITFSGVTPDPVAPVVVQRFAGAGGPIGDAFDPGSSMPHIAKTTAFNNPVALADPNFSTLSDLDVTLSLVHADISQLRVDLVSPLGTRVTLFRNRVATDNTTLAQGLPASANFGIINGYSPGVTFNQEAPRSITNGVNVAPYIAHFRPESGSLATFYGKTAAQLNGNWTLEVTDNRADGTPTQSVGAWSLKFVSRFDNSGFGPDSIALVGALTSGPDVLHPATNANAASPASSIGAGLSIAYDTSVPQLDKTGAILPGTNAGRLYAAFTGGAPDEAGVFANPNVYIISSDNGGTTSTARVQVNDDSANDHYSEGRRAQFMPSLAVDPLTGTLAVSWFDGRQDASTRRLANYVATSIDGGATFSAQGRDAYFNVPKQAIDTITGKSYNLEPIPNNFTVGTALTSGMGVRQSLLYNNGKLTAYWAGNQNLDKGVAILSARSTTGAGPRIVSSDMGPVGNSSGFNGLLADGTPRLDGFRITFDRPVDPTTLTDADVIVQFRSPTTPLTSPATNIPVAAGAAIALNAANTTFFVPFQTPQTAVGTYSYAVGPNILDKHRTPTTLGNSMDQNADGTQSVGFGVDTYSTPRSTSGSPFSVPYATDTLPIIIPGPTFTFAAVPGKATAGTGDTLNLDTGATGVDVLFDREIDPLTFTSSDIIGMTGPLGNVPGPFTVVGLGSSPAVPTKSFHIGFPTKLIAAGPYTIEVGSDIASTIGDRLDMNQNAGLAVLRGTDPNASSFSTVTRTTTVGQPAAAFVASGTASMPVNVPDTFVIAQNLLLSPASRVRVTVNLTHPNIKELDLDLVSPDGLTRIRLFSGANILPAAPLPNLRNTIFDDGAVTPIQLGGVGQFNGIFNPELPLTGILGRSSFGNWTLQVRNNGTQAGTIDNWSLELPKADIGSGLGEPVADRFEVGFRIFTQEPSQAVTKQQWTPFGPAPLGGQSRINRITGLAMDPSDPSGNTTFVGGASGGIWKTTNFLTQDAAGPNWIPLTDFGPSSSLNTGGIAVFARNNDPNQSIVFAVTGEGDTASRGVGVLRSLDGGRNWKVLDSTRNAEAIDVISNILPIDSTLRDRRFVGTSSFKIIVDPKLTPTGEVIVYMANNLGIWRSNNTGRDWTLIQGGDATDVTLSAGSVSKSVGANNNLNILYTAIRGQGIFFSPNAQNVTLGGMQQTVANQGNPLFQDPLGKPITIGTAVRNNPNGSLGRITLAAPALSDSSLANDFYQGWLYAFIENGGLYQTKDFGRNWVRISYPFFLASPTSAFGTNNEGAGFGLPAPDHAILGAPPFSSQAAYDIAIGIDPTNPSIVYLGGTNDGNKVSGGGFIRVDTTFVNDSQSLIAYNNSNNDNGSIQFTAGNGPITVNNVGSAYGVNGNNSVNRGFINLYRDPTQPFLSNSTLTLTNVNTAAGFNNSGFDAKWSPFPGEVQTDVHRIITFRDPLTGKSRLITGDDQGIASTVDDGTGRVVGGIGNARFPSTVRNGNLQLNQIYYGATQPSQLAADIAGSLFYATTQDNGFPISTASLLTTGDLGYSGPGGDGTGIATDQTGTGTSYVYAWPCCGGFGTNFFQVTLPSGATVSRTSGLLQTSADTITANFGTPGGQWGFTGGHNFAVNPIDGNGIIIGSGQGRVFRTTDQGINWFPVGEPGGFNQLDGSEKTALAFGAPNQASPGVLNNFLYIGGDNGKIYVTETGGAPWRDISAGLSGGGVGQIVPNPTRGSRDLYAVTGGGVFYKADSRTNTPWVNITDNLFQLRKPVFGEAVGVGLNPPQINALHALAVDWRYAIPDATNLTGAKFPVVYVGGEGGVFRSRSRTTGSTWTFYPNETDDTAVKDGGYLPNAQVSDLDLSLGNIDPTTGFPVQNKGGLNLLVASTYGRGAFGIRINTDLDKPFFVNFPSGPQVTNLANSNAVGGPSTKLRVTFNSLLDDRSVSPSDIVLLDPTSAIVNVTGFSKVSGTKYDYDIVFNSQTVAGFYKLTVGPNISDVAGNPMNQNNNNLNGEADDAFSRYVFLNGAASSLVITGMPTSTIAGSGFDVTVVAQDMTGATIVGYTGVVTFSSSDSKVSVAAGDLPPNYTFAATDNGRKTFHIIFKNAGPQTLFVDPVIVGSINPAKADTIVLAADASFFKVTGHPSPSVAGVPATVTVTAFDPYNNQATGYIKTAKFTSSDAKAVLPADYTFMAGDLGSKTFTKGVTLKIASATASITATDTILGTLTGTQSPIVVMPAAASGLFIEMVPDPVTAGVSNNFNLVARDPFGNQATGYLGTVNLTVTDTNSLVSFPTTYTFMALDLGSKTLPFTLITAGKQTLMATAAGVATGTATTTVKAAAAKTFDVFAFPSPIVAGVTSNFIVTARDAFANKADGYVGTVLFASSDKQASLPFNYVFGLADAGEKAFSATLKTAATQTITATDTLTATITGTQTGIVVIPAAASQLFAVGYPSPTVAGVAGNITITLKDAFDNIATGYKGTVSLISSDAQAGLPANYTFTALDAGVKVLTANLKTAGTQSLTATDTKIAVITGKQSGIVVTPAKASQLFTTGFPAATIAGVPGDVTVTLKDAFNNIATGYKGTVAFTSTDAQAGLPTNYTFTSTDAGVRTFANGVSLKTAGTQSITSTDTLDGTITGTQSGILVIPAKASQLFATGYPNSVAGIAGNLTVTLKDAFNNIATGYTGKVQITSSDIQAGLPANYAFTTGDAGVKVLTANLKTAGLQTLTGTDTVDPTIVGTQSNILITPAAAAKLFATDYPTVVEAGVANNLKVTLKDAFGNVATGFIGTVRVRSSDAQAGLPANYTFTALDAGVKLLPTSLGTVGFQSLTAADTVNNSLTSTVSNIQVVATLAGAVLVTGFPSITTAGVTGGFTVKVLDPFRNVATGYTGTVHFSSTDVLAGLPADYTFTATDGGIKSFIATLKTSGNQSITASDTIVPTITGVEAGIFVNPATANSLFISSFQSQSKANESTALTVTAKDQFGNIATGFNGTVSFASTDKVGVLPSDFTFSSVEQGIKTFTFSLRTPGFQDVTVSGNNLTSATGTTKVLPSFDTKTTLIGNTHFAVGVDTGTDILVRSYNAIGTPDFTYVPSPLVGYTGGARVSTADFDGDGVPDIVVGTGPGVPTQVIVTNGVTLKEMFRIQPFEASFTGGVYVTAGDVTGDGIPELIITPDEGGGPRVRVFNGNGFGIIADFFGIDDVNFRGGARAAVGDINGDKVGDLIVAAGFGGGPRVAGYDGRSLGTGSPVKLFADFFAFEQGLRNGIFVAAGDVDGDGKAELIAGGGPGGGPRVTIFSGNALLSNAQLPIGDFFAGDPNSRGGVRVAVKDLDGDKRADIITGSGTAAGSKVTAYFGKNINGIGQIPEAFSFDAFPGFAGGVFVG